MIPFAFTITLYLLLLDCISSSYTSFHIVVEDLVEFVPPLEVFGYELDKNTCDVCGRVLAIWRVEPCNFSRPFLCFSCVLS